MNAQTQVRGDGLIGDAGEQVFQRLGLARAEAIDLVEHEEARNLARADLREYLGRDLELALERGVRDIAVFGSATETTTWEIEVHSSLGGAPLFRNTGRTIQAPDGTTEFRAGPLGFWDFFNGDTSVLGPLCAALGG